MIKDLSKKAQVRGSKTKKKKLISYGKLVKKVDDECSLAIRRIDNNIPWDNPRCEGFICNNHLIRRGNHKVRFNPLNCFAGTSGANFRNESNPHYMISWYLNKYGQEIYQEIKHLSMGEAKWKRYELESLLEFFKDINNMPETPSREWVTASYLQKFRPEDTAELLDLYSLWCSMTERENK